MEKQKTNLIILKPDGCFDIKEDEVLKTIKIYK